MSLPAVLVSLPVFLIIIAGWLFRKFSIVNNLWVQILNLFSYYVGLPALIIISFWNIDFLTPGTKGILFESLSTIMGAMLIAWAIIALLPIAPKKKASLFLVAVTGNSIYMGFPIMQAIFNGQTLALGTLAATIYLVLPILASVFVVGWWSSQKHSLLTQLKDFATNPLVIASVLGVLVSFSPQNNLITDVAQRTLALVAVTASPVALFALGAFLYKRFMRHHVGLVVGVSLFKVIILPMSLIGLGVIGIPLHWGSLLVVLATMPAAVTTFVIAEKFGLDETIVCNALIISTVISFFSIPLFVSLV